MRDQHRSKQDLINEVTALRKQIADLEELLRALADNAPVELCLLRPDGRPLMTNLPFVRLLGYESLAELLRVAGELGLFAGREEQIRVLALAERGQERVTGVILRRSDGRRQAVGVIGSTCAVPRAIVLVVLQRQPQPWLVSPLSGLNRVGFGGMRSA
ncbi:MAG: hypothetical protein ACREMX_08825 [Gemmatimonadales bacterium]